MATMCPPDADIEIAAPHEVALPYRGDGVACALRQCFRGTENDIPADMMALLAAIDRPRGLSDRD